MAGSWDGQTQEVADGVTHESSGWVLAKPAGDGWVKTDERWRTEPTDPIVQGPERSENEPDRGAYPNVAWVKDGDSKECPDTSGRLSPSATQLRATVSSATVST